MAQRKNRFGGRIGQFNSPRGTNCRTASGGKVKTVKTRQHDTDTSSAKQLSRGTRVFDPVSPASRGGMSLRPKGSNLNSLFRSRRGSARTSWAFLTHSWLTNSGEGVQVYCFSVTAHVDSSAQSSPVVFKSEWPKINLLKQEENIFISEESTFKIWSIQKKKKMCAVTSLQTESKRGSKVSLSPMAIPRYLQLVHSLNNVTIKQRQWGQCETSFWARLPFPWFLPPWCPKI